MTGLEGNKADLFPGEISGEAILNLKGQIDSPLPKGPVIILFYYTIMLRGHSMKKQ